MASPNGLALGLELLDLAGLPPEAKAAALRSMAERARANLAQVARIPTGATAELEALCRALSNEVDMMHRQAMQFERQAEADAAALTAQTIVEPST